MPTSTTNYGWQKPDIAGSNNLWGSLLNTDLDGIDSTVHSVQTSIPAASTSTPVMDGTAAVGTGTTWARADHVHPVDTSRYAASNPSGYQTAAQVTSALTPYAPLASPTFTGTVTIPAGAQISGYATTASLPTASTTTPIVNGTAAIGSQTTSFALADHIHPTDGSRAPLASPTFTGTVTIPAGASIAGYATTSSVFTYANLPAEVQQLPVAFSFAGKPANSAMLNVTMVMAVTVASALANSKGNAITAAAASTTFTVNKVSSGTTTALGTAVFAASGKTTTFSGAGGSLAAGDIMQLVAPATADTALADIGITIMAMRT